LSFLVGVVFEGVDVDDGDDCCVGGLVLQVDTCPTDNIGTSAKIKNKFFIDIVLYL
jgi:hypothetical protein